MQFQQLLTTLAKGQEELKTLLAKEKKKKEKKPTGVVIMGRRFQGQTRRTLNFATTSDEGEGKGKETAVLLYPKIFPPIFLKTLQEKSSNCSR